MVKGAPCAKTCSRIPLVPPRTKKTKRFLHNKKNSPKCQKRSRRGWSDTTEARSSDWLKTYSFVKTGKITHRDFEMQEDKEISTRKKKFAKISEEQGMIGHNRGKILRLVENFGLRRNRED